MKHIGKLCLCLAGGLVLNASLRAGDEVSSDNPYAPIVTRNVFDIHPLPPVDPNQTPADPPPKITPNGITSVLGHLRALFKVSLPPKPGVPGKDQTYMLSEGEQQDDIEVTKIDEAAGIVTFNNHGTIQELPLIVAQASGPSVPAPGGPGPVATFPGARFIPRTPGTPGGPFNRFGQSSGVGIGGGQNPNSNGGNGGGNNAGANNGSSSLGVAVGGAGGGYSSPQSGTQSSPQPTINNMSPDDIQRWIALQKLNAENAGNPISHLYPTTKYDPPPPPVP